MSEVNILTEITPPTAKRCNIITIEGCPMIVVYDFMGGDFRDNLTFFLEKSVRNYVHLHRKEKL